MMAEQLRGETFGRPLTERETTIVNMLWQESTNAEIGSRMSIATKTVESHLNNIREKLGIRSRVGLALWYERNRRDRSAA